MSIKAIMDGQTFDGVTMLTASDGKTTKEVTLSEVGTVPTPTGIKEITENGTFDVTAFAQALVNVAGAGGGADIEGEFHSSNWNTQKKIDFENPNNRHYIIFAWNKKADELIAKSVEDNTRYVIGAFGIYKNIMNNKTGALLMAKDNGCETFTISAAIQPTRFEMSAAVGSLPDGDDWKDFYYKIYFID